VIDIPPVLPNLELLYKVGEGGMSSVWKANHLMRGETVAVKILNRELTQNQEDIELFTSEARIMSRVDHRGIVKCYELNCFEGTWYYTMEFVDGYNFGSLLERKQHLQEADCLLICESIAVALDYAWNTFGIVHCDIKPENIMINTDGIVKLTDLGLCHTYKYLQDTKLDVPDHVMGTPAYISPEQVYGDVEPDCRSDIYSLAASLYHLSTGRVIFPGLDSEGMMRSHCSEEAQGYDPRAYRPGLSEGFCQLLEAMLVKNRDYRISSWRDVYSMCITVEQGGAFKPRTGEFNSSVKIAPPINAAAESPREIDTVRSSHQPPKNPVTKLFRAGISKAKLEKDPVTGKTVLKKKSAAVNPKFKIHRPADW
jgi:serine/threonine protein kinase